MKIISGGQTGADQAGLHAGHNSGFKTGGIAPKGWRTETGPAYWLADFGLEESDDWRYNTRTRLNIEAADLNIIFLFVKSKGTLDTIEICKELDKAYIAYDKNFDVVEDKYMSPIRSIFHYKGRKAPLTINIAGNRESVSIGIYDSVYNFLMRRFAKLK